MHTKAFPYIGLLSFLWGTNDVASRIGINTFDPYTFIALRLAIATIFFGLIYLAQRRALPVDGTLWRHAGISGLIGVAIPMTLFTAAPRTNGNQHQHDIHGSSRGGPPQRRKAPPLQEDPRNRDRA